MIKDILLFIFSMSVLNASANESLVLKQRNGVSFIIHEVNEGETILQIAKDYFIKPALLSQFNHIDNTIKLALGSNLEIPLTETNFFKFASLTERGGFTKVLYELERESSAQEICKQFGIASEAFFKWNNSKVESYYESGYQVVVGWLKRNYPYMDNSRESKKGIEVITQKKAKQNSENYSQSAHTKKGIQEKISTAGQTIASESKSIWNKTKKTLARKPDKRKMAEKESNAKENKNATKSSNEKSSFSDQLSELKIGLSKKPSKSKEELAIENKNSEERIRRNAKQKWNQFENWTMEQKDKLQRKPSYADNYKRSEELKKNTYSSKSNEKSNTQKTKTIKITKKPSDKENTPNKNKSELDGNLPNHEEEYIKETPAQVTKKEIVKENESKIVTFKNSKNGKASYFFSGPKEGKFYAVTSLANKGSLIKVTCLETNKSIMAEVISVLPASDAARGLLIKISDNAKLALKQKSTIFNTKVSY